MIVLRRITMLLLFLFFLASSFFSSSKSIEVDVTSNVKIENESFYSPYPAEPGRYVDLWLRIRNALLRDVNAENVICEILPKFPFSLDEGQDAQKYIGTLAPGQTVLIRYRLKIDINATEGENEINFRCKSKGYDWTTTTIKIFIKSKDVVLRVNEAFTFPKQFLPGENGYLFITLENLADTEIKDISVSILLNENVPFLPFNDISEKRIKIMNRGEVKILNFSIVALPNANEGIYKLPIILSYANLFNDNFTKRFETSLTIKSDVQLFAYVSPKVIIMNESIQRIFFTIANNGKSKANNIIIKLKETEDYLILNQKDYYIGNLDSDDTTTIDFLIFILGKKDLITLPVEISYRDIFGNSYNKKFNETLNVISLKDARDIGLVKDSEINVFTIIIAVILALMIINFLRKILTKRK